jgi:hypothetical protein
MNISSGDSSLWSLLERARQKEERRVIAELTEMFQPLLYDQFGRPLMSHSNDWWLPEGRRILVPFGYEEPFLSPPLRYRGEWLDHSDLRALRHGQRDLDLIERYGTLDKFDRLIGGGRLVT